MSARLAPLMCIRIFPPRSSSSSIVHSMDKGTISWGRSSMNSGSTFPRPDAAGGVASAMLLQGVVLQAQCPRGLVDPVLTREGHGFRPQFLGQSLTTGLPARH